MRAVYKRELHSYMTGMAGYAIPACFLLAAGLFTVFFHVIMGLDRFGYTVSAMQWLLFLIPPVLAMRSVTEDRRAGMDRWYGCLPLPRHAVVLGKYFALLTVFGLGCVMLALYPLAFYGMGMTALPSAYVALVCYFLLGAALLALCLFVAYLSRGAVLALVLGVLSVALCYVPEVLCALLPTGHVLGDVLAFVSLFGRQTDVCMGLFDLSTPVFYVSFAALFLFFATRAAAWRGRAGKEKRR